MERPYIELGTAAWPNEATQVIWSLVISRNRLDTAPAHAQSGRADNVPTAVPGLYWSHRSHRPHTVSPRLTPSHPSQGKFWDFRTLNGHLNKVWCSWQRCFEVSHTEFRPSGNCSGMAAQVPLPHLKLRSCSPFHSVSSP